MNGFDGALTTLGIIMGAYLAGVIEARVILSAGLGASIAMGISGAFGAYITEKAERTRYIKELEKALFTSLTNSIINRASQTATIFVAFIDALSPICTTLISLSPFILSLLNILPANLTIIFATILNITTLFILGVFLGRVSKSNVWLYGSLMVLSGFIIILIFIFIGTFMRVYLIFLFHLTP